LEVNDYAVPIPDMVQFGYDFNNGY
jgi:hypothetical protein